MDEPKSPSSMLNTLLIVDDSEMNRAILAEIFKQSYFILEAGDGAEGLRLLEEHRSQVCAVLLDVQMPVMDGMEMLRRVNASFAPDRRPPVFLITAEASQVSREAYRLGVMDVIEKPVVPYIVTRRVNSVVELFQNRRALAHMVQRQEEEIRRQTQTIVDLNRGMIEALATSIEFRSSESGEHVHRIHDITGLLLRRTHLGDGLSEEQIQHIALASIMHDVGKIAIADAILNKPGRLTPAEYEIMKTHTVQGARLLERIPQMRSHPIFPYACDIARHHHERWDGRGYPDGLRGDEITVWAQAVSIADVYDALVSKRIYKDAFGVEQALEMIRTGACGVFSPQLLDSFFSVEHEIRRLYRRKEN